MAERGILDKGSDPADGRKVLLKLTPAGFELLERIAPYQQRVNDTLFEFVDARRFRELRALAAQLVERGDRAVAMLELLIQEAEAT
jgi:DNA-binding MarR family transcriptional regulator